MKKIVLPALILIATANHLFSQMNVTSGVAPAVLVGTITGGGIVVSNITTNGVDPISQGTFACTGACNIGISGGILITSGSASVAAAVNVGTGQGAAINNLGDPQLAAITTGTVHDASVLEFDFIAVSDTVIFNYVFASDEYSDYANSTFNDVFGFFISGPGITGYQNIALIPGMGIPVTINNVNNGGPVPHGTPPPGPCQNCAYFLDNSAPVTITTAYDGLTTVLTATGVNLQPGLTYHLKLAVADVTDQIFDTGAFIEAGSFLTPAPPWLFAGGNRIMGDTVQVCSGSSVQLSAPFGFTYLWSTGATTQAITVGTAGTYSVTIIGSNISAPVFSDPLNFVVVGTAVPQPVLSQNGNTIMSSVNSPNYNYSWTINGTPIAGANTPTLFISQNGCYSVTVQDTGGCYTTSDTLCTIPLSIAENIFQHSVLFNPNPFSQSAQLSFDNPSGELFEFKIMDLTGREVKQQPVSGSTVLVKKENLLPGIYFYKLRNETGDKTCQGKFIIN